MLENIHWLGHASIKITGEKTIYIDPWKIKDPFPADIVLITHDHYDHCVPEDIKKVMMDKTVVISPRGCAAKLNAAGMKPGETKDVDGVTVKAVPAYNTNKDFHPKGRGWLGYLITINGKTVYVPGDTDVIPEMGGIKADIAFFPVGGTYTMDAQEAAEAANRINPGIAVPIHYGDIVGSEKDAQRFKELCRCRVYIMEAE